VRIYLVPVPCPALESRYADDAACGGAELPCDEQSFSMEIPRIVETMRKGQYLAFLAPDSLAANHKASLDLQAHFLRLVSLRKRVLR
jgi:hypothetical protein